jgi:LmbE family N-acetylglucosaminyl deacetylase
MFPQLFVRNIKSPILIVAPHPDDEVLSSGGLIQSCVATGKKVFVLYLTMGDAYTESVQKVLKKPIRPSSYIQLGNIRHQEAVKSLASLGIPKNRLFFMCFPDGSLMKVAKSPSSYTVIQSRTTHLTKSSYPFAFRHNASYCRKEAINQIQTIIKRVNPATIIVCHEADTHPDHRATRKLLITAKQMSRNKAKLLSYLIHFRRWPQLKGSFLPPTQLRTRKIYKFPLKHDKQKKTYEAFRINRTQFPLSLPIRKLIRANEYFWLN